MTNSHEFGGTISRPFVFSYPGIVKLSRLYPSRVNSESGANLHEARTFPEIKYTRLEIISPPVLVLVTLSIETLSLQRQILPPSSFSTNSLIATKKKERKKKNRKKKENVNLQIYCRSTTDFFCIMKHDLYQPIPSVAFKPQKIRFSDSPLSADSTYRQQRNRSGRREEAPRGKFHKTNRQR